MAEGFAPSKQSGSRKRVPQDRERLCSLDGLRGFLCGGRFGGADGFDAGIEATLVARRGIGVDDALLHAFIDGRNSGAILIGRGFGVAGLDGLAESAQGAAEVGFVGAVDSGLFRGLTGALERRNVVRHG